MRKAGSLLIVLAFAAIFGISAVGQDLGSSNKLFGGSPKAPATVKATKKPPVKPKATTTKSKPAAKKPTSQASKPLKKPTTVKPKPTAVKSTGSDKSRFSEFKSVKSSNVEITVSKPNIVAPAGPNEERYEGLIESGNRFRDERNYSSAETSYKNARLVRPKDSRATYGLGNLYSDQQRWEEAETAYRAALLLDPNNAIAHVALSYVLTQPIAAPNLSERYEEAEKLAQRAIQLAASNALAFDQLGVAMELRGLIGAETENAYRRAIQLNSGFAPAYAHLGRLLRRRGLLKESAAAYEDAIRRSTDVATMILVAEVMQSEQRFAESEKLLQTALNGDPRNPAALLLMGRSLTAQGRYADAERVLRSSLSVSANSFTANSLLGSLYARQGNFAAAESVLLDALRSVSPLEKRGLSQQFEMIGDGFLKAGNRTNAGRAYKQAIALDNENQALVGKLVRAQKG